MGANTPASGGEQKPVVKNEGRPPSYGGRNNANRNNNYNTREKFLGEDLHLCRKVFEAKLNWLEQVANFRTVDGLIKVQVGTEYILFVLESLAKDTMTGPQEQVPVYMIFTADTDQDVMFEVKKMKFKSMVNKYLTRTDKTEMQLKQVFWKYYGQVNEDMYEGNT